MVDISRVEMGVEVTMAPRYDTGVILGLWLSDANRFYAYVELDKPRNGEDKIRSTCPLDMMSLTGLKYRVEIVDPNGNPRFGLLMVNGKRVHAYEKSPAQIETLSKYSWLKDDRIKDCPSCNGLGKNHNQMCDSSCLGTGVKDFRELIAIYGQKDTSESILQGREIDSQA